MTFTILHVLTAIIAAVFIAMLVSAKRSAP